MKQQKSFDKNNIAALYIVPTPIGNLEDMTYRAIRILKEVDTIAAEDTRQSIKLLNHFEIKTPLMSYHEHNKRTAGEKIIEGLRLGKSVALISDAGMPAISDPGYELVSRAIEEDISVIPLPGANAALPALVASGLSTDHFYFYGFLNRQKKEKKLELENLKKIRSTIIFYESPHRLKETLTLLKEIVGDRKIVLARELTKKYEEFLRGTIQEAIQWYEEMEIKGEFCLILEGSREEEKEEAEWWTSLSLQEHVEHYISIKHMSSKDAIKQVSTERNVAKREVYQAYHVEK